jgi:hypothetical protein
MINFQPTNRETTPIIQNRLNYIPNFLQPKKSSFATMSPSVPVVTFGNAATVSFGNRNSFAATLKHDPTKTRRIIVALSKDTPPDVAKATLNDSGTVLQFLYIAVNDTLNVVTRPFPATNDSNEAITLGGRGDVMDQLCPAVYPAEDFHGHIITMIKEEDATNLNLASNNVDPLQLDEPAKEKGDEAIEEEDDDVVMITKPTTRLGWKEPTGQDNTPVFVALRTILPLPPGVEPPIGLNIKKDKFPTKFDNHHFPALKIWYEGMQYLYQYNNMQSLLVATQCKLFNPSDIDPEDAFTKMGYPIVDDPWTTVMPIYEDIDTQQYNNVLAVLRGEKRTAILRVAENASLPREPPSPMSSTTGSNTTASSTASSPARPNTVTPGTNTPSVDPAYYTAMFDGLANSKLISSGTNANGTTKLTLTEREQQSKSEDVVAQYQLLFARISKGTCPTTGKDTELLVYPKLTGQFTQFLKTHRGSKAAQILQAHIQAHAEKCGNSDKLLDGVASLDPNMFDAVFSSALRKFGWTTEVPTCDADSVKYDLGIYHFAQVRTQSHMYTQRVEQGRIMTRQEDLGEDKSRREKKITELYHYGLMRSREEILIAIANFYSFSKYMIEDMEKDVPTVIKALLQVVKILNSMEGRRFGQHFRKHPEIFHSMLMDTQQIFNNFTRIATRYEYRQAVLNQNVISVDAYKMATNGGQMYINKIYNATTQMAMDQYNVIPLTLSLFNPPSEERKKSDAKARERAGRPKPDGTETDSDRKKENAKKKKTSKGTPGILRWEGKTGTIPFPNVWQDKPDGTRQKLCANFAFQDRICKRPGCTFFHAKTQKDLSPGVLADLQKWVLNTDKVEFADDATNGQ